jgi:hypothetical protein
MDLEASADLNRSREGANGGDTTEAHHQEPICPNGIVLLLRAKVGDNSPARSTSGVSVRRPADHRPRGIVDENKRLVGEQRFHDRKGEPVRQAGMRAVVEIHPNLLLQQSRPAHDVEAVTFDQPQVATVTALANVSEQFGTGLATEHAEFDEVLDRNEVATWRVDHRGADRPTLERPDLEVDLVHRE